MGIMGVHVGTCNEEGTNTGREEAEWVQGVVRLELHQPRETTPPCTVKGVLAYIDNTHISN